MAMVVAPITQDRGIAEIAQGVRIVVKHTFLDFVEDETNTHSTPLSHRVRPRSCPPMERLSFTTSKMDRKSTASTEADDTDDETVANGTFDLPLFGESDDDTEESVQTDNEAPMTAVQAPPGVWANPAMVAAQTFMPVCVTFVPVIQQPMWPQKSSRSARRRRARAVNRWYRHNMQNGADGEQQEEAAFGDDVDSEFDDDWQLPESNDIAESLEIDADSWPMPVDEQKAIKA